MGYLQLRPYWLNQCLAQVSAIKEPALVLLKWYIAQKFKTQTKCLQRWRSGNKALEDIDTDMIIRRVQKSNFNMLVATSFECHNFRKDHQNGSSIFG
jgi:hypothetical protein